MSEVILSVNAGSSSVKVSAYKPPSNPSAGPVLLAETAVENLTTPPANFQHELGDEKAKKAKKAKHENAQATLPNLDSHEKAFNFILDHLIKDKGIPELGKPEDVRFVCHRVVHGGDCLRSQAIDKETFHYIKELTDLAPLHNAPALSIISAASEKLPHATNVAYFDSAFHTTIPRHISTYAVDQAVATKNKLRKYGFHGISYSFIVHAVSEHLQKPKDQVNIIALHLGSGASACCIRNGASLDTSMGLTPLEGLPGATRSGAVDPSLMFHFTHHAGKPSHIGAGNMQITQTQAEEILNKKSGWKSLTGTADFSSISLSDREEDRLAFDMFVDRILNYVPSYFAKLNGQVDALVFAGGIGERGSKLRKAVIDGVECLGFLVDDAKNDKPDGKVVVDIGAPGANYRTLVCRTDEQLEMARGILIERDRLEAREGGGEQRQLPRRVTKEDNCGE